MIGCGGTEDAGTHDEYMLLWGHNGKFSRVFCRIVIKT
jgi:hypothetical protein